MLNFKCLEQDPASCKITRRDFMRDSALGAATTAGSLTNLPILRTNNDRAGANCILLFLVGGPSQLDTWDPKPPAPSSIRGPFRPIRTNVPGIEISEHFPLMARMADRFAIVRSVHHEEAAIHETGHQLMQTGHAFDNDIEYPHYGAALSFLHGSRSAHPPFIVLPGPIGDTGARLSHGQSAGFLGAGHQPLFMAPEPTGPLAQRYGESCFGRSCLTARRLVEKGVRMVVVNMFPTVFNRVTWDCHADGASLDSSLYDYAATLCPTFDQAYTALLEDLYQRGLLSTTLVVAMGEFGRTPKLNPRGGRDHWPGVWSILFAGGGVRGGQVIGSSDKLGAEPRDRPVSPAQVAATIYHALGVNQQNCLPGPQGRQLPLMRAEPVKELF